MNNKVNGKRWHAHTETPYTSLEEEEEELEGTSEEFMLKFLIK